MAIDDKQEAVFNAWMNYVKRKKVDKTADKNLDDDADDLETDSKKD